MPHTLSDWERFYSSQSSFSSMPVDLSPVEELDIDQELLDFAPENYCANCSYCSMGDDAPYCQYWEESTEIESGMICSEYLPQGYE